MRAEPMPATAQERRKLPTLGAPPPILPRLRILAGLALRNTARNARRSLLTASAMVIGLALLVISRGIAEGAHEQWIEAGVRLSVGHVAIEADGYPVSHSLSDRLGPAQVAAARAALAAPAVTPYLVAVAPRLESSGLASGAETAVPVLIEGVDPVAEAAFSQLDRKLVEGRYLKQGDRLSAYVGTELAQRLSLHVGSRLVLTAQGASGQLAQQLVRVVGTFRTGIPEMDQGLIHIPIETARAWLGTPGAVTSLSVLLHSSHEVGKVVRLLRARLASSHSAAGDAALRVLPWTEASPELYSAVRVDDYGDYVFHGILFAIAALAVLNAMLMSVLNRTREFGVLESLGLTHRETGAVVFFEGVLLTALSGVVGILLGLGVTWTFWRHGLDLSFLMGDMTLSGAIISPILVPHFRIMQVVQSLAFIAVIGVLASLYPARQAMRIDVAEAMKFDQ